MPKSFNDLPATVQVAVFVLIAVVLAGAVFYFYVLPLQEKRDTLRKQVDSLKAENKRQSGFRATAEGISDSDRATGEATRRAAYHCP